MPRLESPIVLMYNELRIDRVWTSGSRRSTVGSLVPKTNARYRCIHLLLAPRNVDFDAEQQHHTDAASRIPWPGGRVRHRSRGCGMRDVGSERSGRLDGRLSPDGSRGRGIVIANAMG